MAQQLQLIQPISEDRDVLRHARELHRTCGQLALLKYSTTLQVSLTDRLRETTRLGEQRDLHATALLLSLPQARCRVIVGPTGDQYEVCRDHDTVSACPYDPSSERECPTCGRRDGWESECIDEWHEQQAGTA